MKRKVGRPVSDRTCEFKGCEAKHYANGLCRRHWNQKAYGSKLSLRYTSDLCSVDGCHEPRNNRGYCMMHYMRWRKHGSPLIVLPRGSKGNGGHADYPNHSYLKRQRKIILAQYPLCGACGLVPPDLVHHKDGTKTNHELDNLLPVCQICHKRIHKILMGKKHNITDLLALQLLGCPIIP